MTITFWFCQEELKLWKRLDKIKKLLILFQNLINKKKVIACICSGAQLLISAKVVKGRKIAGYYSMEDDLINAGAIYTDEPSVVDGNIVTTAHYKDLGPWMKATLKLVEDSN